MKIIKLCHVTGLSVLLIKSGMGFLWRLGEGNFQGTRMVGLTEVFANQTNFTSSNLTHLPSFRPTSMGELSGREFHSVGNHYNLVVVYFMVVGVACFILSTVCVHKLAIIAARNGLNRVVEVDDLNDLDIAHDADNDTSASSESDDSSRH